MDKCHIIIVDTINSRKFNSKNVKNILNEIVICNSHFMLTDGNYLSKHIEYYDLDMKCDKIAIEKALLKEHLFINIIGTSTVAIKSSCDVSNAPEREGQGCGGIDKKIQNHIQNSLSFRYYSLLRHAFISRSRNALFLLVNDDDDDDNGNQGDNVTGIGASVNANDCWEINWMGLTAAVSCDQRVMISPCQSYERKMQIWLLTKLIALDGNFPFYSMPILSKLISLYSGIVQMRLSSFDSCESELTVKYENIVARKLTETVKNQSKHFNVPIFIHGDKSVDWNVIRRCVHGIFSSSSAFIGHYKSRIHPICQDVNFLLVSLLKYFKVYPKDNQLPFTSQQMATIVSECLISDKSVQSGKFLIIFIEDMDWVLSPTLSNNVCSWLPEKCAHNIQIIVTSAKDSVHEKSLKCRLNPPMFVDVSYEEEWNGIYCASTIVTCPCPQTWCLSKLLCLPSKLSNFISKYPSESDQTFITELLSMFTYSTICGLTRSQIDWLFSFGISRIRKDKDIDFDEKDQWELSEKFMTDSNKEARLPLVSKDANNISIAINELIDCGIIKQINLNHSDEPCYSLAVPQLSQFFHQHLQGLVDLWDAEIIKMRLGAYYVYETTNLHLEMLFVPSLLEYLSGLKDTTLHNWLLNYPVFVKLKDEYSVPVKLLSLWRAVLGPTTDYTPMINAYIHTYLPDKRDPGDCPSCKRFFNVELQAGPVKLAVLRQSFSEFSKSYCKHRYRVLLDLARTSMQVGQYTVAKEMARSLLKQLDYLATERAFRPPLDFNRNLLASCLHLLFCTLDERLKTFEFVTEQTTPIFRRTVHYGSRALLLQQEIVTHIQRAIDNKDNHAIGDVRHVALAKLQQQLCQAEIRIAHIMTHFIFSLDGLEQTVINRHFMQSEIRSVTYACMSRAHEIATRLKDRQLLLEIEMTFGVIQPRENFKEKILLYKTPLRQALCIYGERHIFVSRLYINIGISYEEQKKYIKAFKYFTMWSHVTHELLGRNHCKSLRSCGVFKEPIFKLTAEFVRNLNDEEPSDNLEEEFSDVINNIDPDSQDQIRGPAMSVAGVAIAPSSVTHQQTNENVSYENIFMLRNTLEHDSDWEIHSSDDETPNYTTAFEEVIGKFKKRQYNVIAKELLQSILGNPLIDSNDLSKDDIESLLQSQEVPNELDANSGLESAATPDSLNSEAFRITRMFRDLRELAQWIPTTNLSPSDISLSRRLLELQRELEEFLDN